MNHLKKGESGSETCFGPNRIMQKFQVRSDYLREAEKPLGTIATAPSALTIVSILLFLNGRNSTIQFLGMLSLLFMPATVIGTLFYATNVLKKTFRLSRIQYHFKMKGYLKRIDCSNEEFSGYARIIAINKGKCQNTK